MEARQILTVAEPRHFLTVADLGRQGLTRLVDSALAFANGWALETRPLQGKIVGIYFRKSSTRTRTSFTVGALKLGAQIISYGPNDLQLITGETIGDTARVLSGFIDALVIRTNESFEEMALLAGQNDMAVINAMSENEHPTQVIGDLAT